MYYDRLERKMTEVCSVILVNYNGFYVNEECIDTLLSSHTNLKIKIIVVDNASSDSSIDFLQKKYGDEIQIIEVGYNSGFSHANNVGIRYSIEHGTDYIMLLNNDTSVDKYAIQNMYEASKLNPKSFISPRIMYYDRPELIWFGGGYIDRHTFNAKHRGENEIYDKNRIQTGFIEFATGCCLFSSANNFAAVGELDEEYFLYYEDADYSERIKEKTYSILFIPNAVIYHKVSWSSGGKQSKNVIYYATRNRLYYVNKYFSKEKTKFYFYYFPSRLIYCIKWILKGDYNLSRVCIQGIIDYFKGITGIKDLTNY